MIGKLKFFSVLIGLFAFVSCKSNFPAGNAQIERRDFSELFDSSQGFYAKYSDLVSDSDLSEELVDRTVERCIEHFLGNQENLLPGWTRDDYLMELHHIRRNRNTYVFVFGFSNFNDIRVAYEGRLRNGKIVLDQYYHIPHF